MLPSLPVAWDWKRLRKEKFQLMISEDKTSKACPSYLWVKNLNWWKPSLKVGQLLVDCPGPGYSQYTWRGGGGGAVQQCFILQIPPKIHEPGILHPKSTWHQNFLPKEIQDLNTSILIYSIKQTLWPKKIRDRSLDSKKYRGYKFSTPKNMSMYVHLIAATLCFKFD